MVYAIARIICTECDRAGGTPTPQEKISLVGWASCPSGATTRPEKISLVGWASCPSGAIFARDSLKMIKGQLRIVLYEIHSPFPHNFHLVHIWLQFTQKSAANRAVEPDQIAPTQILYKRSQINCRRRHSDASGSNAIRLQSAK